MNDFIKTGAGGALEWFFEISKIPRPSGFCGKIADFLADFAKERGLEYTRDKFDNVIIRKPASAGYEDRECVILQGHLDIVAEKTPDCKKDLTRDGLDLYRDGDFLRARGTTLGADDGVFIAYALAILSDNTLKHPPLEFLFTSDEETGLTGAKNLDAGALVGKRLINIDSDEDGVFVVGCAGGVRADITLSGERCVSVPSGYRLSVTGLRGGHSGSDINCGRLNALKIAARTLDGVKDFTIADFSGGSKDNAIPREAVVDFYTEDIDAVRAQIKAIEDECRGLDDKPTVCIDTVEFDMPSFDEDTSLRFINLVDSLPFGVREMSEDFDGLVLTSMNIGTAKTGFGTLSLVCSLRSGKEEKRAELLTLVKKIAEGVGAECKERDAYPGWDYNKDSDLCRTVKEVYLKRTGEKPKILAIHAGLECGILSEKIKGLDCISIGPDNFDYHTTEEHLSVPSFLRFFDLLAEVLENL